MGKAIYLAGKISKNGWRNSIVDGRLQALAYMHHNDGWHRYVQADCNNNYSDQLWPRLENAIFGIFDYVGPYFIGCDHGCYHGDSTHGQDAERSSNHGQPTEPDFVIKLCLAAIHQADYVYAWLDAPDAYGTLIELGYAHAHGKPIYIASSKWNEDMWFAHNIAAGTFLSAEHPREGLEYFFKADIEATQYANLLESPIEKMFWEANKGRIPTLIPQVHIGRYRADFAIPARKVVIELDGHEYHKTKEQRTNDAKRERYIAQQGWHVIRFTGSEVYRNADQCIKEVLAYLAA